MPKKVWKIDQFHGGVNSSADARDIADNELAQANEIMVDEIGKIRMMGATAGHGEVPDNTALPHPAASPGYGLFVFSHDRIGGGAGDIQHLSEAAAASSSHWAESGEGSFSNNLTHTHGSTNDTEFSQTAANRIIKGVNSCNYKFTYTVGHTAGDEDDISVFRIVGGSNQFANANTNLTQTAGTHETTFESRADAVDNPFTIKITTTGTATITIDDMSLKVYNAQETGEDYMVMVDSSAANLDIYGKSTDIWNAGIVSLSAAMIPEVLKAVFYVADGTLRVSDADFGANNNNQWYGYIKRTHFSGLSPGGSADTYDGWFSKNQSIAAPTRGLWGGQIKGTCNGGSSSATIIHNTTDTNPFGTDSAATLLAGTDMNAELDSGVYIAVHDQDNLARLITARDSNVQLTTITTGTDWSSDQYRIFPPAGTGFTMNLDMNSSGGTYTGDKYQYSQTFIYDGGQESLPVIMAGDNFQNPSDNDSIEVEIFCTSPFDPRIIGGRIYQRKHPTLNTTGTGREPWSLFVDISLKNGVRENLDDSYSEWEIESGTGSGGPGTDVYMKNKDLEVLTLNALTYEAINGYSPDEVTLDCKFKTAVVANRMVYVGNIQTKNEDGETVVLGDAMIKSPVNQFDVFPPGRRIEASVRDGDEIVKLEVYADRILQFKKHKMHLINISQEIEFLEDTFMHKGVNHPSSVCKTDFGIAWVNNLGVYLYDGKEVHNLFEKKGSRVIDEAVWNQWVVVESSTADPLIGYFPQKRHLIVRRSGQSGTTQGDVYLFDMVTRSWTYGDDQIPSSDAGAQTTNFVTDWNGDLVISHNDSYGSTTTAVAKWMDNLNAASSNSATDLLLQTKDIDFGFPSVRKKVYRVDISYRGNASALIAEYTVNGESDLTSNFLFEGTNSDGTPNGSSDSAPLLDKSDISVWHHAELVPDTPSQANNIYSFQFSLRGAADHDFEINDISIVYKLKNIR